MKKICFTLFILLFPFLRSFALEKVTIQIDKEIQGIVKLHAFEMPESSIELARSSFDENNLCVMTFDLNQPKSFAQIEIEGQNYPIFLRTHGAYFVEFVFDTGNTPFIKYSGTDHELNQLLLDEHLLISNFQYKDKHYYDWPTDIRIKGFKHLKRNLKRNRKRALSRQLWKSENGELIRADLNSSFESIAGSFLSSQQSTSKAYKRQYNKELKHLTNDTLLFYNSFGHLIKLREYHMTDAWDFYLKDTTRKFSQITEEYTRLIKNNSMLSSETVSFILADYMQVYESAFDAEERLKYITEYQGLFPDSRYLKYLFSNNDEITRLEDDPPAPAFTGSNEKNELITLPNSEDKWLYVDIWATWCGPCREEFKYAKKLHEQLEQKQNLTFVYLSIDKDKEKWVNFLVNNPDLKGLHLNLDEGETEELSKNYRLRGVPQYLLINPEGLLIENNAPHPSDSKALEILKNL